MKRAIVLVVSLAVGSVVAWRNGHAYFLGADHSVSNVVILTLDTTRADRLGAYGFAGADTPNIDRMAAEGVVFEQAESAAPLTLPAHSSLFTGRFPFQHGIRDNGEILDPREVTLAQLLQARGVRTAAFAASYVLDARWGLARGFDVYDGTFEARPRDGVHADGMRRSADEIVDRALAWLNTTADSPFFAWLHFYDAHTPYDPPEGRANRAGGYDGAIAFMDAQIGRVLAYLDARGLRDRTLVVLVADHGESLGEHGERAHGLFIYESVTRVPLIIRGPSPRMRGRRVADVVRSVDVMPTVLDILGLAVPAPVAGVSLVARMRGAARQADLETYSETMYPRYHFGWSELRALRAGRLKLVDAPRPELYDLAADPGEAHNLYDIKPALAANLAGRLRALDHDRSGRASSDPPIDSEARTRLAALGYVSGSSREDHAERDLADPKDKIALYQLITGDRRPSATRAVDDSHAHSRR